MHRVKHGATGLGFLVRNSRRLLSPAENRMRRGVGAAAGRCQPFTTVAIVSEHANWYSSGISRAVKDSTSVKGNSIWLGQYFRWYMTNVNLSKQFGIYHGKHEMLPCAVRTLASNYSIDSSGRILKETAGLHFRFIAENQHYGFRQFSVFNEFSKQLKGEAKGNSEFQQSVKEFNKKIEVVKEDLKVRTKMTTEKLHKSVDNVWTEAEATAKKVSANVKEKISAATEEVKDTIGLGKQESEGSTNTSTSSFGKDESFGAKDESSTRTRAENSQSSEASNSNESAGQTSTLFGRFKSAISSASPTVSLAFQKLKETKISDLARKGYDMVKDELSSNPSRRRRMQYASAPTSSVDRSTKTDIVIVPTKRSRVSEKWEAFKNKMQGHPMFKRVSGISQPVVTKGQELAEDIRERWETSDHPVVHKIQDLSETVLGETATALSFKEIRRRDPSFSLPDFVAEVQEMVRPVLIAYLKGDLDALKKYCSSEVIERCKGERKAFESQGMFFDNKILHISEIDVRETKMMGSTPIIIVGFQTQQIYCVRDREGEVTAGGQDTIQTVYYAWAMQQLDTEELGEGAYFPVWRLREMQQIGVQALI